jgi:hypothetical protein
MIVDGFLCSLFSFSCTAWRFLLRKTRRLKEGFAGYAWAFREIPQIFCWAFFSVLVGVMILSPLT